MFQNLQKKTLEETGALIIKTKKKSNDKWV